MGRVLVQILTTMFPNYTWSGDGGVNSLQLPVFSSPQLCIDVFIMVVVIIKLSNTNNPPSYSEITHGFQWGSCCSILSFLCSIVQTAVCPVVLFLLAIVLSVRLRFTASDYLFGILDLRLLITPWYLRLTASDYHLVSQIYAF